MHILKCVTIVIGSTMGERCSKCWILGKTKLILVLYGDLLSYITHSRILFAMESSCCKQKKRKRKLRNWWSIARGTSTHKMSKGRCRWFNRIVQYHVCSHQLDFVACVEGWCDTNCVTYIIYYIHALHILISRWNHNTHALTLIDTRVTLILTQDWWIHKQIQTWLTMTGPSDLKTYLPTSKYTEFRPYAFVQSDGRIFDAVMPHVTKWHTLYPPRVVCVVLPYPELTLFSGNQ